MQSSIPSVTKYFTELAVTFMTDRTKTKLIAMAALGLIVLGVVLVANGY